MNFRKETGDGDSVSREEDVFAQAEEEWNRIATLPILDLASEDPCILPATSSTVEPVTLEEIEDYFLSVDVSEYLPKIKPTISRNKLRAFLFKILLLEPPNLPKYAIEQRNRLFAVAFLPFSNKEPLHYRFLVTLNKALTSQPVIKCPRYGNHWEQVGFQGTDPATDLRGVGLLGLYQLLFLTMYPKSQRLARDIYQLSTDSKQNFPFCVMGTNLTQIALQALREKRLNREIISRKNVIQTFNYFYGGLYLQLFRMWRKNKTISDAGTVLKDLRKFARKEAHYLIEEFLNYEKRKASYASRKGSEDFVEFTNIGTLIEADTVERDS